MDSRELGGHGFAHDDCARLAQGRNSSGIPYRSPALEQRRTLFGWHIGGLYDVLDANRHAVNC